MGRSKGWSKRKSATGAEYCGKSFTINCSHGDPCSFIVGGILLYPLPCSADSRQQTRQIEDIANATHCRASRVNHGLISNGRSIAEQKIEPKLNLPSNNADTQLCFQTNYYARLIWSFGTEKITLHTLDCVLQHRFMGLIRRVRLGIELRWPEPIGSGMPLAAWR